MFRCLDYFVYPRYAERNREVRTNFVHEFYITKQDNVSVTTRVQKRLICELYLTFQHERAFVGVLLREVLSISLFLQRSIQMTHASVEMASPVFTTNTSGRRRILMVQSILDTSSSSALMSGEGILVTVY
jgi:hypothetical protein